MTHEPPVVPAPHGAAPPPGAHPPPSVGPWLAELLPRLADLVAGHLPQPALDRRLRERVLVAVAEAHGASSVALVHRGWRRFLGVTEATDADEVVVAWARRCAEAGRPLDPAPLDEVLEPEAVALVRATVARGALASRVGAAAEAIADRLSGQRPIDRQLPSDVVAVVVGGPPLLPSAIVGGLLGWLDGLVPAAPEVDLLDAEPNLLAHVLADALPGWLAGTVARATVLRLPVQVVIGVQAGLSSATVRIGHGRVAVANGLAPDAWLLLDGQGDPLVRAASGSLSRELRRARIRPA